MRPRSVSHLDLCQHAVDVTDGIIASRCGPDDLELLADPARGLAAMCQIECLPNPFGYRHLAGARGALNLMVFGVFEDHLQSFSII